MDVGLFLWVAIGVVVSVVLPVLTGIIRRDFPATQAVGMPPWVGTYGRLLVFSLLTALVVVAAFRATSPSVDVPWFTAFLLGYGWEATVEKLGPQK